MQTEQTWGVVGFILEGLTFIFVRLELRAVLGTLGAYSRAQLVLAAAAVSLAAIGARVVWVLVSSYLPGLVSGGARRRDPFVSWRYVAFPHGRDCGVRTPWCWRWRCRSSRPRARHSRAAT